MRTKEEVLNELYRKFPNKVIYFEQYKSEILLSCDINRLSHIKNQTCVDWLNENGFEWRETGYIEPEMRYRESEKPANHADVYALADYVFTHFPLAGEFIPDSEQEAALYQEANKIFRKMLTVESSLTKGEEAVLMLETIEILKKHTRNNADFWNYIYQQYGFRTENSEQSEGKLYARFCRAIRNTLTRYKRFIAPKGTMTYYTSLQLHAISPKNSIENLFNILFDFYVKNLDFQYIPGDVSFNAFTRGMRARWNSSESNVQLRSDTVFSGLRILFMKCSGYMASLSESIVKKMDLLLREENTDIIKADENYWDYLLLEWYNKKSTEERTNIQMKRSQRKEEYVATSKERIYVHFVLENEKVGLSVPKIRLSDNIDSRPVIEIWQNDTIIFEDELTVTGNDLCFTTKKLFIPIDETRYDFASEPQIRVEIRQDDNVMYNSGNSLMRNYVIFDSFGKSRNPKSGTAYLFAAQDASVEFLPDDDNIYQYPYPYPLYRFNLSDVNAIAVNGTEIMADESVSSNIRHHVSHHKIDRLHAVEQGNNIDIFNAPIKLNLCIPKNENILRYRLQIDGENAGNLEHFKKSDGEECKIPVPQEAEIIHCIKLIDVLDNFVKYEYQYLILSGFEIKTDKPLYRKDADEILLTVSYNEKNYEYNFRSDAYVNFSVPSIPFHLEYEVPCVSCEFRGENAFCAPKAIWHEQIDADEFVKVDCPKNWTAQLMLGEKPISSQKSTLFELGNELRSSHINFAEQDLSLRLKSDTEQSMCCQITRIIFTPKFLREPFEVHDGILCWNAAANFLGNPESEFYVKCDFLDELTCDSLSAENKKIKARTDSGLLPDGRYPYQVFLKKKSIFSSNAKAEKIFDGVLTIGDPNKFLFDGKQLYLKSAIYWSFNTSTLKSILMMSGCGIIQNLQYQGKTVASGEEIPLPCYFGKMYFVDRNGEYHLFNSKSSDDGNNAYELINPVKIWIVNEHLLILRCVTDDAVYIDKRYDSIVNENPDMSMSKSNQRLRLRNPDYFEYTIKEL